MSPRELIATKVSRKILSMLTPGLWMGTVAAIFEHSLNLTMRNDFLIHIGSDKLMLTPRAILLSEKDFHERLLPGCSSGQPRMDKDPSLSPADLPIRTPDTL
jgi:hypothetical protein